MKTCCKPFVRSRILWLLTASMISFTGCWGGSSKSDRPQTAIARGVVTYHGEPVQEAVVVFQPNDPKGFAASAFTDANGKFDLKTFPPESGAVPGPYAVMVLKVSQEDAHPEGGARSQVIQPKSLVPAKYSNPSKSELHIEIPDTGNDQLVLDLKD